MNYRALIFDDDKDIRKVLWLIFDNRGYEVFTFPHPATCPLSTKDICPCEEQQSCADVIISDIDMPVINGVDFIEEQINKGCRCENLALMSGDFTQEHISRAKVMGIKTFNKPFTLSEINDWLDNVEKKIDPNRKLADWYLKDMKESDQ